MVFSTKDRASEFSNYDNARQMARLLKTGGDLGKTQTLAFVVMPDHVHWLLIVKQGSLSDAVQRVKLMYSKISGNKIWNKGFYDYGIRSDEDLVGVARYIVANSLRAGLVDRVGDHSFWDAIWL